MASNISSTISQLGTNLTSQAQSNQTKNNSVSDNSNKDNSKIDFGELLKTSNENLQKERQTDVSNKGLVFSGDETQEQFFAKLSNQGRAKREDPKNVLNKDDFLKLFITQLSNQDPLKPEDSAEMSARLAQFNSLEQMMNMNSSLDKLIGMQSNQKNFDLIKYIGKQVKFSEGQLNVDNSISASNPQHIRFSLPQDATKCTVEIIDESSNTVVSKELGACKTGFHSFDWDGLLDNNQKAPAGKYHFVIRANDIHGAKITPELNSTAKITGIDIKDSSTPIITDQGKIKLEDIASIEDTDSTLNNLARTQIENNSINEPVVQNQDQTSTSTSNQNRLQSQAQSQVQAQTQDPIQPQIQFQPHLQSQVQSENYSDFLNQNDSNQQDINNTSTRPIHIPQMYQDNKISG